MKTFRHVICFLLLGAAWFGTAQAQGFSLGVALAAIQGLNQKLEARQARIAQLEATLARFEERLSRLEQK